MGLIYLASPYTHDDPLVMQERYELVCEYTAKLKRAGRYVFSPIAHCHGPALYGLPREYEYWKGYCELMLPKCDEMLVLMLDGYEESKGISGEVALAKELGMPLWFTEFDEIPEAIK
jgi:hypothetical protein